MAAPLWYAESLMLGAGFKAAREFVFEATPAVAESRARQRYVGCTLCRSDHSQYLFHKTGVRFVRCRSCGLVYVNPVSDRVANYFDIARGGRLVTDADRELTVRDFERYLSELEQRLEHAALPRPRRSLLLGRYLPEFVELPVARRLGLELAPIDDAEFAELAFASSVAFARPALEAGPDLVIFNEFLEACSDPAEVLGRIQGSMREPPWLAVVYANVDSVPARLMRNYWPHFFEVKTVFLSTSNVVALLERHGYERGFEFDLRTTRSVGYVLARAAPSSRAARLLLGSRFRSIPAPLRTGNKFMLLRPMTREPLREKLSIVLPAYNEERYVASVIEAVLAKPLKIDKELIIVESNSSDRTRDIVRSFEGRPGVRVVLEDRPRGKGHAVRTGLAAVTGSIILIQDADFEYDIGDYDALLEPILQRRTHFVLGSRSLGLDDWKVRRFANNPLKGLLMNLAQVGFAKTFNLLYQQRTTDVNTMFKVFRRECLDGMALEGNGFELDIELVCKLVAAGYAPLEVPVNYVSRGFDEGKKINFWRDAFSSYGALFTNWSR